MENENTTTNTSTIPESFVQLKAKQFTNKHTELIIINYETYFTEIESERNIRCAVD